jgi:hypothetical protein
MRVWNLKNVPFNIYPDEIMTGLTAERAYIISGPSHAPSVFRLSRRMPYLTARPSAPLKPARLNVAEPD